MTVAELLGRFVSPESPWPLVLAAGLLVAASLIGRRLFASIRRLGARVGGLESAVRLELTRRRQIEHELRREGVELSYWPPDGPAPELPERELEELPTTRVRVPPLPTFDQHRR